MTVVEVVDKLKELGGKIPLSSSDKSDIEVIYHKSSDELLSRLHVVIVIVML